MEKVPCKIERQQYSHVISHLEEDEDEEELIDDGDAQPESPVGCWRETVTVRPKETLVHRNTRLEYQR